MYLGGQESYFSYGDAVNDLYRLSLLELAYIPLKAELILLFSYPCRLCRSAWVGRSSPSVCLSVCLFVCLFVRNITQKRMIQVFKIGIWEDLGIS